MAAQAQALLRASGADLASVNEVVEIWNWVAAARARI
jgi:hypothetical protein